MDLVAPSAAYLAGYLEAVDRGWQENELESPEEVAARVRADPAAFLAQQERWVSRPAAVALPDGSRVSRLPGFARWMWDGEFAGRISLRWQPGTVELPPTCLGHVGYSVVPWKRRRGYATQALRALLPLAARLGLPYVELSTDPDNVPSQRVIEANGGRLVERFTKPPQHGGGPALRYRVSLTGR